ncbi:hypothetical protein HYR69_08080, partial [Candidatus Sumerlaeota bacterium]|nr:hypothetical protein [Candidatus Sumerlaeota bacterium]
MKISRSALIILTFASSVCAFAQQPIPDDFPHFIVPGHEKEMETMRQMFWLHYQPAGPMATLWDEWLSGATLWPAIATDNRMNTIRERWAETLSNRHIDSEGYVATHQHASIAHQDGWPFPAWPQGGSSAWGWHFAVPGPIYAWGKGEAKSQKGWELSGGADRGIDKEGWNVELTSPSARIATPRIEFQADNSPFIQMRWRASGMDRAQPFIQWMGEGDTEFSEESRYYF